MASVTIGNESLFRQLVSTLPAEAEAVNKVRETRRKEKEASRTGGQTPAWASSSLQASQVARSKERAREVAKARQQHLAARESAQRVAQAKALEESRRRREAEFEEKLRRFDEEQEHARGVEEILMEAEEIKRHKSEQLYREWCRDVYDPLQSAVRESARALGAEQVRAKKRELFEAYLDATRRKRGGVFRDVVIEGDYDPFRATREIQAARRSALREAETARWEAQAATGVAASRGPLSSSSSRRRVVRDPLKWELTKRREEDELIAEAEGRTLPPVRRAEGRKTLSTELWSKLEATPYGDREIRQRDQHALARSNVVMDHFNDPTPKEVARELGAIPRGKRTVARVPGKPGARVGKKAFPVSWRSNVIAPGAELDNHHSNEQRTGTSSSTTAASRNLNHGSYSVRDNTPFAVDS